MGYYQHLQRNNQGYAAAVAERLWPNASDRRPVCRLLADFINRAASTTTAWSVTLYSDHILLNVGPVRLMALYADTIWIVCCTETLIGVPPWMVMEPNRRNRRNVYPAVPIPSAGFSFEPCQARGVSATVRSTALRYVTAAAERRSGKSAWVRSHSPGVVRFLNSYLGQSLPIGIVVDDPANPLPNEAFEGAETKAMRIHRYREQGLREAKLADVLSKSADHRLCCEVPGCEFDFEVAYGTIGRGYAQVHHLVPLSAAQGVVRTRLDELAVVCANCHSMIHRGGECRPLKG